MLESSNINDYSYILVMLDFLTVKLNIYIKINLYGYTANLYFKK